MAVASATLRRGGSSKLFDPKALGLERTSTLEDVVVLAWVCLRSEGTARCLVCGGRMRSHGGCSDCGSSLE